MNEHENEHEHEVRKLRHIATGIQHDLRLCQSLIDRIGVEDSRECVSRILKYCVNDTTERATRL